MEKLPNIYTKARPFDDSLSNMFPVETHNFLTGVPELVFGTWETNDEIDHFIPVPLPNCYNSK